MTATPTILICNFGPLLNTPLRLFLEMIFSMFAGSLGCPEYVWEESFCFGSVDLA